MLQPTSLRPTILQISRSACLRIRSESRNKSITAAIERGRSSGDRYTERIPDRRSKPVLSGLPPDRIDRSPYRNQESQSNYETGYRDNSREYGSREYGSREYGSREYRETRGPRIESLPYTTAASEFIYGYSSVLAAIKAKRRKLYKLYVHTRGDSNAGKDVLIARARSLGITVEKVGDETLQALDRASSGRPHNGFVLEASPLPIQPLTALVSSSINLGIFEVALDRQSQEEMSINSKKTEYKYKSAGWRHPLILYVDGVLDEGNLGAIARSAYFLGVDAMVTPTRQSAPWSHIAVKASAGAAEALPMFKVNQASDFLGRSARAGWRIYASDAVPAAELPSLVGSSPVKQAPPQSNVVFTQARNSKRLPVEHCPVESHPTILMMGAEGTGLRSSLLNLAHFKVGIVHGRETDEVGVDSLNVSVAASLLCYAILQKPKPRASTHLLF